jgi:hypothetical protein
VRKVSRAKKKALSYLILAQQALTVLLSFLVQISIMWFLALLVLTAQTNIFTRKLSATLALLVSTV